MKNRDTMRGKSSVGESVWKYSPNSSIILQTILFWSGLLTSPPSMQQVVSAASMLRSCVGVMGHLAQGLHETASPVDIQQMSIPCCLLFLKPAKTFPFKDK